MILALSLALMTAVAVVAVLLPLVRRRAVRSGSDVAVYRDQLDEIERDLAAGRIGKAEADVARVEVSRRLLAAAEPARGTKPAAGATWARRTVALVGVVLVPLGAVTLYLTLGSPRIPAEPLASRTVAPERLSMASLIAQAEAHLARNPDDGRGWEVLAPVYFSLGRFEDAAKARRNAVKLLGSTAAREAELGQALVAAAEGAVTPEARAAFARAAALDADNVMARYYLGLAAGQDGKRDEALGIWQKLLKDAPAGAPWIGFVQAAISRLGETSAAPDGTDEMVLGMVSRLAERLKTDGSDLDGWVRLVRSYKVLGDDEKARAAAEDGRRALAAEPDKVRQLDDAVRELGLRG